MQITQEDLRSCLIIWQNYLFKFLLGYFIVQSFQLCIIETAEKVAGKFTNKALISVFGFHHLHPDYKWTL